MSRRTVRDLWYREVLSTPLAADACRVLLLHLAHEMTEQGYVKVPREQLADVLGIHPKRVTARIGEAVKVGLLVRVSGGHNGQVAQYAAQLTGGKGPAERVPTRVPGEAVGTRSTWTYSSAERVPTPVAGAPRRVTKVPAERDPYDAHARARGTSRTRAPEPAPDGSRVLLAVVRTEDGSDNGMSATPAPFLTADPSVPTTQREAGWSA